MKIAEKIFIVIFMLVISLPLLCMPFASTEKTNENRTLASMPSVVQEGKPNVLFLSQLGDYFQDHFAFKQYLVSADSIVLSKLFKTSSVSTVTIGKGDWLFYSATDNNYLGQNLISERGLFNIVNNLKLMQDYVEENNGQFLMTVAPNKNSLYGENMPYFLSVKASNDSDIKRLEPLLKKSGVNYLSLYPAFEKSDVLYFQRDSHWNNTGAAMVHNMICQSLNLPHVDYSQKDSETRKDYNGDLNKIIFPYSSFRENNSYYELENGYEYLTKTQSTEEPWIITQNKKGTSSALVYRDSFGNSLLPFFADTFHDAYFSKALPYNLKLHLDLYKPENVIVEKCERNLIDFAKNPPVFVSPQAEQELDLISAKKEKSNSANIDVEECEANTQLIQISGFFEKNIDNNAQIYVSLTDKTESKTYRAFCLSNEESDYGFRVICQADRVTANTKFKVFVVSENNVEALENVNVSNKTTIK